MHTCIHQAMDRAVVGMREGGRRVVEIPADMNEPAVPSLGKPHTPLTVMLTLKAVKQV
jgi:hypothetical protein